MKCRFWVVIRELLLNGCLHDAMDYIKEHFNLLWEEDSKIQISLMCLRFIELVKESNLSDAIKYAQKYLSEFGEQSVIMRDSQSHDSPHSIQVICN